MRVAHFTDVHFHRGRAVGNLLGKRGLGMANLYLRGRRSQFDADRLVPQLVRDLLGLGPDLVVFSGDLTALSTHIEFELAREALEPLLTAVPTILVPGNHDRYAPDAERRMEELFGPWMCGGRWVHGRWEGGDPHSLWPRRFEVGALTVFATDCNRPGILSNGQHHPGELARLAHGLEERSGSQTLVVGHYPVLDLDGSTYDRRGRSLLDVLELRGVLESAPPLAYLHGHEHRWFVRELPAAEGASVRILGCGSSAYSGELDEKRAGFFTFEVGAGGIEDLQRHGWDGTRFGPGATVPSEPPGA